MSGTADLRQAEAPVLSPQERKARREGYARGWLAAIEFVASQPLGQIEPPARDTVAQIGAALEAAQNDPVELTRIRQEHRLHPYAPTCTPACRMGAW